MRELDLKLTPIDGDKQAALIEMVGTLDGTTAPRFEASVDKLRASGILRLILDMAGLRYVNSTGLGTLVKHADTFRSGEGGMALVKVPGKVQIIIEMSGLVHLLAICPDVPTALSVLRTAGGTAAVAQEPADSEITQSGKWRSAAARLAAEDPELAMRRCRTALERALRKLYQLKLAGDSTNVDMNTMLQVMQQQGLLPVKVFALSYAVWELAKVGSQPVYESEDALRREAYIAVASMTVVQSWFKQFHPEAWGP